MWEQIRFALHASLARVLTKVAILLPAVLSLVLAVLVCGLLGLFLAYVVRKILVAFRFDERVKANSPTGLLPWSPVQAPSLILSRLVFWGGIFLGLVLGIAAFGAAYSPSEEITSQLFPYLTRIVSAILLLLAVRGLRRLMLCMPLLLIGLGLSASRGAILALVFGIAVISLAFAIFWLSVTHTLSLWPTPLPVNQ